MLTESFSDHFVKPELALEMLMNINISLFGSPEDVKRILIERANPGKEFSQDVRHVAVRLLGRLD